MDTPDQELGSGLPAPARKAAQVAQTAQTSAEPRAARGAKTATRAKGRPDGAPSTGARGGAARRPAAVRRGQTVTTVAEEIRQNRAFRSPAQEALLAVLLTADRLQSRISAVLAAEADITHQQYNVLRILRGAGAQGLPTLSIGERMIERAPGVTRLLDRLERKGLIERVRQGADRRQVHCRATAAGLALLQGLDPVMDALDDRPGRELSAAELRTLVSLLDRMRACLR